jgi:hypothetical protein
MQTIRKIALKLFIAAATIYAILALYSVYFPTHYAKCERNTKRLNGGEKFYAGQKLKIVLCGDGGDENFDHDEMRMQILSDKGDLLAQRKFYVDWNGGGGIELEYGDDYLIYPDITRPNDYKRKVSMPPTRLDWIRARLPFVD